MYSPPWTTNKKEKRVINKRAKKLRIQETDAEKWCYQKLKKTKYKIRKQFPWGKRIFDFWIGEIGVAIEVDGAEHNSQFDWIRDKALFLKSGVVVYRIRNFDEKDLSYMLLDIGKNSKYGDRNKVLQIGAAAAKKYGAKHTMRLLTNGKIAPAIQLLDSANIHIPSRCKCGE